MLRTNGMCPHCENKLFNYNQREWKYGSPIRTCPKCGQKYIDDRYHEIVVDGIAPDAMSVRRDGMCIILGLIFIAISAVITFTTININGTYSMRMVFIGIIGLFLIIFMLIDILRIKTGAKERRFALLRSESDERLRDKSYAYELLNEGYNVPQNYLDN